MFKSDGYGVARFYTPQLHRMPGPSLVIAKTRHARVTARKRVGAPAEQKDVA